MFPFDGPFTGHVQGVGLATALNRSPEDSKLPATLRIRDRRLELDIEGDQNECCRFLQEVESELDNFIRDTERSDGHRKRLYTRFRIA